MRKVRTAAVALRPLVAEKPTAVEWEVAACFALSCFLGLSAHSLVSVGELELASLLARTMFQVPFPGTSPANT